MASIHTMVNACFYALISVLLLTFAAVFRKYVTRAKVAAKLTDVEANITDEQQKHRLRTLVLPAKLDPVIYPSAARRSSRHLPSSQRVIPNPFRARFGNERYAVVDTTTLKMDGGDNIKTDIHANNDQPSTAPISISIPPRRPPRPTLLDDLLAGFPCEHDVARDRWFPLSNAEMGRWELFVVRGARPASRYVQRDGRDGRVLALKQERQEEDEKSFFSIDEGEVDNTPLTPSNTLVDIVVAEKSKKSKKRDERRRKKRNGWPRMHVFEIPELYVNARPYEDIEAEGEARASALAAKEAEDEATEMSIVIETEEEEALTVVAAAALTARDMRNTRKASKFLEVPARFFC